MTVALCPYNFIGLSVIQNSLLEIVFTINIYTRICFIINQQIYYWRLRKNRMKENVSCTCGEVVPVSKAWRRMAATIRIFMIGINQCSYIITQEKGEKCCFVQ